MTRFWSENDRFWHQNSDYIYHNSIYWHAPGSNEPREVFAWKCTYEDKYSVSLDFAIKPVERTLQFVTEKGKFDVQMKVYEDETFAPQYEVKKFSENDHFSEFGKT